MRLVQDRADPVASPPDQERKTSLLLNPPTGALAVPGQGAGSLGWWAATLLLLTLIPPLGAQEEVPELGAEASPEQVLDWILNEPFPAEELEPRRWDVDLSLQGGAGYKKNVLYSAVNPLDSSFSTLQADLFLVRSGAPEQDVYLYAFADQRHYFELDRADNEYTVFAEVNWGRRASLAEVNLKGHYLYIDQFFDASVSNADILSNRLRQHEFGLDGHVERSLYRDLYLRLEGAVRDVDVLDYPDDYWAWLLGGRFEYRPGPKVAAGILYNHADEDYDERPQRAADGEPSPGTTVHIVDESLGVYARGRWGRDRRWGVDGALTGILRTDDGGGYYDYRAWRGRLLVRGPLFGWRWESGVYYGDTDYDVRPSSFGDVTSPRLYRTWYQFRLRFDRQLTRRWGCFVEALTQENRSNNPLDVYDHQWAAAGISFRP
jgi:hypothetical protein